MSLLGFVPSLWATIRALMPWRVYCDDLCIWIITTPLLHFNPVLILWNLERRLSRLSCINPSDWKPEVIEGTRTLEKEKLTFHVLIIIFTLLQNRISPSSLSSPDAVTWLGLVPFIMSDNKSADNCDELITMTITLALLHFSRNIGWLCRIWHRTRSTIKPRRGAH